MAVQSSRKKQAKRISQRHRVIVNSADGPRVAWDRRNPAQSENWEDTRTKPVGFHHSLNCEHKKYKDKIVHRSLNCELKKATNARQKDKRCKKIKDKLHFSRLNCVVKRMRISARLLLPGSPPQTWRNSGLIRYVLIAVLSLFTLFKEEPCFHNPANLKYRK
jgi:hypothetical protein